MIMNWEEAISKCEKIEPIIEDKELYDMVISALKKRVPSKPVRNNVDGDNSFYCSLCGCFLGGFTDTSVAKMRYCENCGQAIDWSDEEVVDDRWHTAYEYPPKRECTYLVQLEGMSDYCYAGMIQCDWNDHNIYTGKPGSDWHWAYVPPYTRVKAWRPLPERYVENEE